MRNSPRSIRNTDPAGSPWRNSASPGSRLRRGHAANSSVTPVCGPRSALVAAACTGVTPRLWSGLPHRPARPYDLDHAGGVRSFRTARGGLLCPLESTTCQAPERARYDGAAVPGLGQVVQNLRLDDPGRPALRCGWQRRCCPTRAGEPSDQGRITYAAVSPDHSFAVEKVIPPGPAPTGMLRTT